MTALPSPDTLPFVSLPRTQFSQRGKLPEQHCMIAGIKVSFKLGLLENQNAQAVFIPHSPEQPSDRSVMGGFVRSDYYEDTLEIGKIMANKAETGEKFDYGTVVTTKITANENQSDFGRPSYFFHGFTVTGIDEPEKQFNAVRQGIRWSGLAAMALSTNDCEITEIAVPAIGTGPQGHLIGYQSARAIFAGILDLGQKIGDKEKPLHFTIVIKDDPIHAPIIDEFMEVMQDYSYIGVPPEGEVGQKAINMDRFLDHIHLENNMNNLYKRMQQYKNEYPRYDA